MFKPSIKGRFRQLIDLLPILLLFIIISSNPYMPLLIRGQGYSMFPTISHDSLVLAIPYRVLRVFGYRPYVGDIIVFNAPAIPPIWCHRIVGVVNGAYITKGDNNQHEDPFLIHDDDIIAVVPQVFGKPIQIPKVGYIAGLLNSNRILTIALTLTLLSITMLRGKGRKGVRRNSVNVRLRKNFTLMILGVSVFAASFLMAIRHSGYAYISYQVGEGEGLILGDGNPLSLGVVRVGDRISKTLSFKNNWVFPLILSIHIIDDPYGEVEITPLCAVIPPFSELNVNVTVEGKNVHGLCRIPIAISLIPLVLPIQITYGLTRLNPFLPTLIQSTVSAITLIIAAKIATTKNIKEGTSRIIPAIIKLSKDASIKLKANRFKER